MIRSLIASLLVMLALANASAQTAPAHKARKKAVPYSVRKARRGPAANINPHTGKPYGAGVLQEVKDGQAYLAPGVPMRRQVGYQGMGGYNANRPARPSAKKPTNSSLSRQK